MVNLIYDLIHRARCEISPDLSKLTEQLRKTIQFHTPDTHDMREAIELGDANIVGCLIEAKNATPEKRQQLADIGLRAWAENPLDSGSEPMARTLLELKADPNARNPKGYTAAEMIAPMLGRIEKEEASMAAAQGREVSTAAGQVLRDAWNAMVEAGADLTRADQMRHEAVPSGYPTVQAWQHARASVPARHSGPRV